MLTQISFPPRKCVTRGVEFGDNPDATQTSVLDYGFDVIKRIPQIARI